MFRFRKMMTLVFVTGAFVLASGTAAAAEHGGGYWPADDWATFGVPHGGYADTSGKCKVCHAVHGAGLNETGADTAPATEKLLRTTAASACAFCHITGAYATMVYDGVLGNYQVEGVGERPEGTSAHVDGHQYTGYSGCVSCHSVHGANTIAGSPILKDDPAQGVTSAVAVVFGGWTGYGSFAAPVANQRDFCLDCHDGVKRFGPGGAYVTIDSQEEFAVVFPACESSGCHANTATALGQTNAQFGVDAPTEHDGLSHIMIPLPDYGSTGDLQLAWSGTSWASDGTSATENSCTTCHNSASGFPHYSVNNAFIQDFGTTVAIDGVCGRCHTNTGSFSDYTEGVGKTY